LTIYRNIPIDRVFSVASEHGLHWEIIDDDYDGIIGVEPVYSFRKKIN